MVTRAAVFIFGLLLCTPANAETPPPFSGDGVAGWRVEAEDDFSEKPARIVSGEFTLNNRYLAFKVDVQGFRYLASVNLMVDGQLAAVGSLSKQWLAWDLSRWQGRKGRIEIVNAGGGIRSIKGVALEALDELRSDIKLLEPYDQPRDAWAFYMQSYAPGSDRLRPEPLGSDYSEKYRPQFHFSSNHGYLGDPHGLIYYNGNYHLFFQHDGYWGHALSQDLIHWEQQQSAIGPDNLGNAYSGSAVIDWKNTSGLRKPDGEHPPILIFYTNAHPLLRFNKNDEGMHHFQQQSMAYSLDGGKTFEKYAGNPVLRHRDRDPKVFWHEPTRKWVMALYQENGIYGQGRHTRGVFYTSDNLLQWKRHPESLWTGAYECPDMFEMPVEGQPGVKKWVFFGYSGSYFVGEFDGVIFKPENPAALRIEYGHNPYVTQTYDSMAPGDHRRVQLTWVRTVQFPGMPSTSMMSFPRELTLRQTPDGFRIRAWPIAEIQRLHGTARTWPDTTLGEQPFSITGGIEGQQIDLRFEIDLGSASSVEFQLGEEQFTYDAASRTLRCRKNSAVLAPLENSRLKFRVLIDRTVVELFANDGEATMTYTALPTTDSPRLEFRAVGGPATLQKCEAHTVRSIWKRSQSSP